MRTTAPQRFEQDRDLLHHLTTLTPPPLLMHNGVSMHTYTMPLLLLCFDACELPVGASAAVQVDVRGLMQV